jgi:hypothetical protein
MSKDAFVHIEHAKTRAVESLSARYKVVNHPVCGGFAVAVPFSAESTACYYVGGFSNRNAANTAMEKMKEALRDSICRKEPARKETYKQLDLF